MPDLKMITQSHNIVEKVFCGGVDNTPVSKEEIENYELMLNLIERTHDKDARESLSKALCINEKRLMWRIQHSHELSVDRYKVNAASFVFITATAFMLSVGLNLSPCIQFLFLAICIVLVLTAICILRSRHRLWEDYYSFL